MDTLDYLNPQIPAGLLRHRVPLVEASEGEVGSYLFDYVPAGAVRLEAEDPDRLRRWTGST